MRITKLEEILNRKQLKKVAKIINTYENENVLNKLKAYFNKLEKKGVYHEYLAWVVYVLLIEELKNGR
jgi:hypothetical protein